MANDDAIELALMDDQDGEYCPWCKGWHAPDNGVDKSDPRWCQRDPDDL